MNWQVVTVGLAFAVALLALLLASWTYWWSDDLSHALLAPFQETDRKILSRIGVLMSLASQIENAVAKLNLAVTENNINVGALKDSLVSLTAQVTDLKTQVDTLTAAGTETDPALVAAVDELSVAADAVLAQADDVNPLDTLVVPAVVVESETPAAIVADGGVIDATVTPVEDPAPTTDEVV